jgi:hypothetical protein
MSLINLTTRNREEPIALLARRHNYFPRRFMWRGERYDVHAVEEAWTEVKRGGKVARHFFRVKTAEGTFDLYQDIHLNAWYMARRLGG